MPKGGVFGYHARSRREFGSLAAAADEEERGMAQGWRRGKRLEQKTERPGLLATGRADDDPLRGGASRREVLNESPPPVR